jgi:hypothetical protein
MTDPDETAKLVDQITEGYREHVAAESAMAEPAEDDIAEEDPCAEALAAAEVLYALVEGNAVHMLTVSGDNPVVITGLDEARELARAVLKARGWTLMPYPERDGWRRRDLLS